MLTTLDNIARISILTWTVLSYHIMAWLINILREFFSIFAGMHLSFHEKCKCVYVFGGHVRVPF